MIPCVVYITAVSFTSQLQLLWKHNLRHSDCVLEFFDNNRLEMTAKRLGIENAVNSVIPMPFKVDLWKYALLHEKGGIYIDADMELTTPPENIFNLSSSKLQIISNECVYTSIFAAPPKANDLNKALKHAISNVESRSYGYSDSEALPWYGITGQCTFAKSIVDFMSVGVEDGCVFVNNKRVACKTRHHTGEASYTSLWNQRAIYT